MKKLTTCSVLLLILMFSGTALGQYSTATPSLSFDLETFSIAFFHGVPDSIHNHLDYGVTVEIERYDSGTKFPGLQRHTGPSTIKYSKELATKSSKSINLKQLRTRSSNPNKKRVDLIITIPKKLVDPNWGISKTVKWKLGDDHEPSYTLLRKVKDTGEYQIVIVYEDGVPPTSPKDEQFIKNNDGKFRKHIQAHICRPGDIDPSCQ